MLSSCFPSCVDGSDFTYRLFSSAERNFYGETLWSIIFTVHPGHEKSHLPYIPAVHSLKSLEADTRHALTQMQVQTHYNADKSAVSHVRASQSYET